LTSCQTVATISYDVAAKSSHTFSMNKELLSIKEFAVLCETTPRTIRFYDHNNLIKPVHVDPVTKYRYYSPYQTREFFKVRLLQDFRVPLKQIKEVLPTVTEDNFLDTQIAALKREIHEKQKEYTFLRNIRQFMFSGKPAHHFLKPETIGPYKMVGMTVPKGRYSTIADNMRHMYEFAKEHKISVTYVSFVFYLDAVTYKPKDTGLEICLQLRGNKIPNVKLPKGYFYREFPKTKAKVYTYKGPYEYITLIYQKLYEGGPEIREINPSELGIDVQLNGPWNTKSPYDLVTKIAFPIK
jgi:DNA-binding transcriptional MerR regulator